MSREQSQADQEMAQLQQEELEWIEALRDDQDFNRWLDMLNEQSEREREIREGTNLDSGIRIPQT